MKYPDVLTVFEGEVLLITEYGCRGLSEITVSVYEILQQFKLKPRLPGECVCTALLRLPVARPTDECHQDSQYGSNDGEVVHCLHTYDNNIDRTQAKLVTNQQVAGCMLSPGRLRDKIVSNTLALLATRFRIRHKDCNQISQTIRGGAVSLGGMGWRLE